MKKGLSRLEWIVVATMALLLTAAVLYGAFSGSVDSVLEDLGDLAEEGNDSAGSLLDDPLQDSGAETGSGATRKTVETGYGGG